MLLIYLNMYWICNIALSHTYAYLKWFFIDIWSLSQYEHLMFDNKSV